MKEVTRDEFFNHIGNLDLLVSVEYQQFPYTSLWKTRSGFLVGKRVDKYTDEQTKKYPIVTKYYLIKKATEQ